MSDPFLEVLNGYRYETLLQIAQFNGLKSGSSRQHKPSKEALVRALREQLASPERVPEVLSRLTSVERAVLDHLLLHSGNLPTNVLREELQREDSVLPGPRKSQSETYKGDPFDPEKGYFEDIVARLTLHGLVFSSGQPAPSTTGKMGFSPGQVLIIPEPLRALLPKPPLPPVEWGRGNLPASIEENNTAVAQRDLFIYWSYVRTQPVPLTQAGLVQKRSLRAINERLLLPDLSIGSMANESDSPRLYFLRLLLQRLRLLTCENGHLCIVGPRNRIPKLWKLPVIERTQTCLRAWQEMREWSELAGLNVSTVSFDLPQARGVLLEQLRLLPLGLWVSAERFLHRLAIVAPRLLFQARQPPATNSSHATSPYFVDMSYAVRQSRWFAEVEAAFVGGALSGPLHWLGLVDISTDEGRLLAFRVNPSGARALGQESLPPESFGEARLVVQPNFQILALGPVSEEILANLEMFADRVKADRSTFEYVLSREAVYRAQKDGLSTAEIAAFLQRACSAPLPQNVLRTLQEWGQQHERIVFHRAVTLCQTANPELLDHLLADPAIQRHLKRALTPTVALARPGHALALQEALLQGGLLPALSRKGDSCSGCVLATEQGELCPLREGPDLLLEACLRPLAEERGGKFYVTEAAVNRAIAAGISVPEYLNRLTAVHYGPLPKALQSRIKTWGRYFGPASLRKATLLEVKDAAIADELLADPELAALLSRFGDQHGKVLLVRTDDVERLHRLLRERGVELT